jgi:hypothetical protein
MRNRELAEAKAQEHAPYAPLLHMLHTPRGQVKEAVYE